MIAGFAVRPLCNSVPSKFRFGEVRTPSGTLRFVGKGFHQHLVDVPVVFVVVRREIQVPEFSDGFGNAT